MWYERCDANATKWEFMKICMRIIETLSKWFTTEQRVRQILSPSLLIP